MSLLLDALKKAAEQNAEINRKTDAEQKPSDETLLGDQTNTKIASESGTTGQAPSTEIDHSDISLENEEGDESMVFTDDDVSAFLGDDTLLRRQHEADGKQPQSDTASETNDIQSTESAQALVDASDSPAASDAARQADDALAEEIELELASQNDPTKSLNLVDVPDKNGTEVEIGRAEISADTTALPGQGQNTGTTGKTSAQLDSTSTRTFAPDNYDRTLRKPGSEDVSNLFAGLKSDSSIIMTPEYAKKMFRSKTSAQRVHNFKIYSGTTLGILIVIAVLGILEIDEETINIDNDLRHLKRDPMPGLIKNKNDDSYTDVFAVAPGSEVDATTLQLVESAELIVDTEEVVAVELGGENESLAENTNQDQTISEIKPGFEPRQTTAANAVNNISLPGVGGDEPAASATIQVSSKSRISEKDRWLREAYAAYQRGDDQLALIKYNAVLGVDPANRNALLARAAINIQNNRIAEAMRDYRKLLLANPKDSLAMSSMIAIANYSPAQSETQLKLMIRNEPNSPYLNFALGNIFGAQNRWQEAQGRYFAALENNPDDPNYAYNLAVSLEHIARPKVAIAYYERALNNYSNGLATFNREVVDARLEMLKQL